MDAERMCPTGDRRARREQNYLYVATLGEGNLCVTFERYIHLVELARADAAHVAKG